MNTEKTNHTCPYCKEEIKADALKCKHCHSKLHVKTPSHEGICPFCKEEIQPEAIKCKHCKSNLDTSKAEKICDCNGGEDERQITALIKAMLRLTNIVIGPDPILRDCQNECSSEYSDCLLGAKNIWEKVGCGFVEAHCRGRCAAEGGVG